MFADNISIFFTYANVLWGRRGSQIYVIHQVQGSERELNHKH